MIVLTAFGVARTCLQRVAAGAVLSVALVTAGCGGGGGSSDSSAPATPTSRFATVPISSAYTGVTYTISIMIPANYDADSTLRPVIYAMDADQLFTSEASVLPTMGAPVSGAILVGISNLGSARRTIDFQMPGAAAYFQFLTLELIPYIDAHYRTDPKTRLLSGWSLSGLMSVYAMLLDDPAHRHFSAFMSADGAIWYQPAQVDTLAQQVRAINADLPVTLMLAADENFKDNLALCNDLAALAFTGFDLRFGTYGQGHAGMVLPSFVDQLNYIFKLGPATGGSLGNCGA